MLFKGAVSAHLVCGTCGYVEFYVVNPELLLAAVKERREDG